MVHHAELVAVRIAHDDEVRALRVRPVVHAGCSEPDQPLDMTCLLARVQIQVPDPGPDATVGRELLAEMDEAATSGEHWKILLTSGMGFFPDAYDLFIIGVVATMVAKEWHIAGHQKDLLSSLALLTSAADAVAFGYIADKLGRRKIYGYEVLVLAAGALATAFAPASGG